MIKYTRKQGDSLWLDIAGDITSVDPLWTNWAGKYAIVDAIGNTALHSGDLTNTATPGIFRFVLPLATSEALSVGTYYLILQIENTTAEYREEIVHAKLVIQTQGMPL